MSIKIYHNPRCSKSRQALALLNDNGVEPEIIEYLKTPLSESELRDLAHLLKISDKPLDMMRVKEAEFKENDLKGADNDTLFKAMADFPKLMERPIIVNGDKAVVGRPPENLLDII